MSMRILGVCGSIKKQSGNLALLQAVAGCVSDGAEMTIFNGLDQIPWFNPDFLDQPLPEAVTRWKQSLIDADAILIACPEYGHSLPGVLKNAIDWVIGSGEFYHKRIAITASVPIAERGLNGLAALHQTLSAVDAVIVFADTIVRGDSEQGQIDYLLATIID